MSFLAIFLMGFLDLFRGAKGGLPRSLEKALLGALALFILGGTAMFSSWVFVLCFLVLFSVGCSISWGSVVGASLRKDSPEKFQKDISESKDKSDFYLIGPFKKSPMMGLFARSVVWGMFASLAFFAFGYTALGFVALVAYSVSMPLAVKFLHLVEDTKFDMAIGKLCKKLVDKAHSWPRHELYRGWITGVLLLVGTLFI